MYLFLSFWIVIAVTEQTKSTGSIIASGLGGQDFKSSIVAEAQIKDDTLVQRLRRLLLY